MSFAPGSITIPEPVSKVKLLVNHDMNSPIGYMESCHVDAEGITATFAVAETEAGDIALAEAKAKIRDGLSVGAMVYRLDPTPPEPGMKRVIQSNLFEVSLVSVPAFENTLIDTVTAAHAAKEKEREPMETENTQVEETETQQATEEQAAEETAANPVELTARINAAVAGGSPAPSLTQTMTVTAAADRILKAAQGGENVGVVMAALSDVVPADDKGEAFLRKTWIGELWKASKVERPFIEGFGTPGKLTGLKAYGWRWKLTPVVGKYNSDKTAIPSNKLSTEMAEGDAQDFAAGWDVARKYVDLGDAGALQSIFQMATDDYKRQTEAWFAEQILAQATTVTGVKSAIQAMRVIPRQMSKIGAKVSVIKLGESVYDAFLDLPADQVPWWLKEQGAVDLTDSTGVAAGVRVEYSDQLKPTEIFAWDSRAATYYEHGAAPIRLQALDIPRGGIDISVHGYAAQIVHDPRAILKVDTAAVAGA